MLKLNKQKGESMQIEVRNLSFAYTQRLILNNISFSLDQGDFLTLVGKNGTGKSTLIKCLIKILKVPEGTIFFEGIDINVLKLLQNIGYVPQKVEFSYEFPITPSEILSSAYLKGKDDYYTKIINTLGINPFYRDNVNNLSGGQFQKVMIARALLNQPKLLILDEPTVGIDNESIQSLYEILENLKEQKVTIIISTHDTEFSKNLSDYYLELNEVGDYRIYK
ncbi:MAG TPA: metal ABC transporter ATP-binding protein [Acholeplasmataceae bacterium]|jgi:zinc transport system ATP-binding protein|nr:metal ABC transporter ATP-binding protein [Acholeplasmataceae bacterium]